MAAAYDDLARRLGPRVLVAATAPDGVELALGLVRDPQLGPLVVVGAGGVLVEILADRVVRLPPLDDAGALGALARLRIVPAARRRPGHAPADRRRPSAAGPSWPSSQLAVELG